MKLAFLFCLLALSYFRFEPIVHAAALASEQVASSGKTSPIPDELREPWQHILATYVTSDGGFHYEALLASPDDLRILNHELERVARWSAAHHLEREAKLAFLINAYNAYMLQSVVELWPVRSVLEEDGFFDGREHVVGGISMTLNTLHSEYIRAAFDEPRIHFLVSCAGTGCPWLSNTVVTAENLEELLADQASSFVQQTTVVDRDGSSVQVSKIFDWFAEDFEASGGVRAFLVANLEGDDASFVAEETTTIGFAEFDWATNAR